MNADSCLDTGKELYLKSDAKKLLLQLLVNSALIIGFYFLMATYVEFPYLHYIYLLAGGGLGIYYVIYNRGFIGKNLTPDALPTDMSTAEKQKFIEDCMARMKKSRWMLTVIIPIILTFAIDIVLLLFIPTLEGAL